MVDLSSALAASQDGNVVGVGVVLQHGGEGGAVLGGVHDAGVLGKTRGHFRLATNGNDNLTGVSRSNLARLNVARENREVVHRGAGRVGLSRNHLHNLLSVSHHVRESLSTPPHVVFEFHPGRKESSQVGEVNQTTFLVKVIKESEAAARVTEGCQVLDERNLHAGARHQHARVPGEALLSLEEANLGLEVGVDARLCKSRIQGIVKSNTNCQRSRTETDAKDIVHVLLRSCLETGRTARRRGLGTKHSGRCGRVVGLRFT